jgi:hypothetical protein
MESVVKYPLDHFSSSEKQVSVMDLRGLGIPAETIEALKVLSAGPRANDDSKGEAR